MFWDRLLEVLGVVQRRRGASLRRVVGGQVIDESQVDQLRTQVIRLLRRRPLDYLPVKPDKVEPLGPGARLGDHEVDYHAIQIHLPGGPQLYNVSTMYLDLRGHHTDPAAVHHCLVERMRMFHDTGSMKDLRFEAAAGDLLVRLFDTTDPLVVSVPVGALSAAIVHDQPHSMSYINESHCRDWSKTPEELLALAVENLRRRYGHVRTEPLSVKQAGTFNVWTVTADPYYNASLVLLPEIVDSVPFGREEMFVMIPQRDKLYFVEKPATAEERLILQQINFDLHLDGAYLISPYLFVWSDGRLTLAAAEEILGAPLPPGHDGRIILRHPQDGRHIALRLPLKDQPAH